MEIVAATIKSFDLLPNIFTEITLSNILDVLLVSSILYLVFIFIKQTKSFFIVNAIFIMLVIYFLSIKLDLALARQFFQPLLTFIIVILVVVFQNELRFFIRWISSHSKNPFRQPVPLSTESINSICKAVEYMSLKKIGALLVFQGEQSIDDLLSGGFQADAKISSQMLLSIFDNHTPGHDGAVTILKDKIRRFGVQLPLAENISQVRQFGTRHRAALGISEQSDALTVVVSEERGTISITENGIIKALKNVEELKGELTRFLKENVIDQNKSQNFWSYFILRNFKLKLAAVATSSLLWFVLIFQSGTITQEINVPVEIKFLPKNLVVEQIDHPTITMTIAGPKKDLENFDPKSVQLQIDAQGFIEGSERIAISKSMFSAPSYIQIQKFDPKQIKINIKTVEEENQEI